MLRLDYFSTYDYDSIAAHLEKMASRGWMIEKIGPFFWKYRRITPQKLRFHVSYYPVTTGFDPSPTVGEAELSGLCDHTGWSLAAQTPQMQIFCSSASDPAPMGTDPELELAVIHDRAMRAALPFYAMAIFVALYILSELAGGAAWGLSGLSLGFMAGLMCLVTAFYALELGAYLLWYRCAKRCAAAGEYAASARVSAVTRALQWLCLLTLTVWGVLAAVFAQGTESFVGLIILAFTLAAFSGVDKLRSRLRTRAVTSKKNMFLTFSATAAAFTLAVVFFEFLI